jgi:hypothetical protein
MDEIAGRVGFYEPFFAPAFRAAMRGGSLLTFDVADAVILRAFPVASFQATLCACTRMLESPVLYLEAAIAHKASVRRRIENRPPSWFGDDEPAGQLRAVRVVPNDAARRERFHIPTNMRVPTSSVIYRVAEAQEIRGGAVLEDLCSWEDSRGKRLEECKVTAEARKIRDQVIAIVQPAELDHLRSRRPRTTPLFTD